MTSVRSWLLALIAIGVIAGVGSLAGSAVGQSEGELTRGEPDLDAYVPEPELIAGTEESLEIQLHNEGNLRAGTDRERVTTARGVSVEIIDEGPFDVKSGTGSVGAIGEDATQSVEQRIAAPSDLEPGEYDVTVEVEYAYTHQISDGSETTQERTTSEEVDLTIDVPDEPRFELANVETDVEPGGDGTATLEVENVGSETATDTRADVTGNGGVSVDGDQSTTAVGDLEPGATTSFDVDIEIADTVSDSAKPLDVDFQYDDEDGVEREAARTATMRLTPAPDGEFSIQSLEETLSVGYEGVVTGEVRNDGEQPVEGAVLVAEPDTDSLFIEDTRYALPDIEPGEAASFSYQTDVSGQADPGDRQLEFHVEYSGGDRSTITSGAMYERVEVDSERDEFALSEDEITVQQGETTEFDLEITNQREETLSNIDAKLYTDSPLDTDNDEAYVNELEPGESAVLQFDVSADSDAATEPHPVELDFEYDNARGEEKLSDLYQHPVTVEEGENGGIGLVGWGMVLLPVGGLGIFAWSRFGLGAIGVPGRCRRLTDGDE